ncbi:MAG: S41 family peptidase [Melioribacteraceae bacterium]
MKPLYKLALITIVIISLGFLPGDNDIYFQISKNIELFGRIYKEVAVNYVEDVDPEEFMLAGIKGMLSSLDPYTNFIDENLQKDIDVITKGKYGGIGASVGIRNGNVTIVDLLEGYSAQRQGIKIGDVISKIDNNNISVENYERLTEFLKGDPGTTVNILIKREGDSDLINFNIVREEIEVKNLTYYGFVPESSHNAYLKLSGFNRTAGDEVKKAIVELKSTKDIRSIILDLRGNPGGLLDAAIDVSEKFLKKGQLIVSVQGRDSVETKFYYSQEEPVAQNIKLIVLIDEGSASASEIVAGAIQDHDRGLILGVNSFGKGLVQTIVPLSFKTSLKITTAKYYTPSGRSIQRIDYGNNRVFVNNKGVDSIFYTDSKKKVKAFGGIQPDSVVLGESKSKYIRNLKAEGMFFRFATMLNQKSNENLLNNITDKKLSDEFSLFIKEEKFVFKSDLTILSDELEKNAREEKNNNGLLEEIKSLKDKIRSFENEQINLYKDDLLTEIKLELSTHLSGRKGRILESLKNDKQFKAAVSIASLETK